MRIECTEVAAPDVLSARLAGAVRANVAVVRHAGEHYFVAPKRLGGVRQVPADSMTDALNWTVGEMGRAIERERRKNRVREGR